MVKLFLCAAAAAAAAFFAGGAAAHVGCPGENVAFTAADGTKLVAHRYGDGRTFVVLAHQDGGNLCQWYPYVKRLAQLGYSTLPFDFRGFGESQVRKGAANDRVELDVLAAVKLARNLGARRVFVMGASMGGWAALRAMPRISPPVRGFISLSTPPQYRQDVLPAARELTLPVLYLASQDEGLATETKALYEATGSADRTMRIVPGSAHGVDLLDPTLGRPGWRTARALIETFLRTH